MPALPTFPECQCEKDDIGEQIWQQYAGKNENGYFRVYVDIENGLEWIAGPDEDTNWVDAVNWVKGANDTNYTGGGWAMPSRAKLYSLYEKMKGTSFKDYGVLKITGDYIWSVELGNNSTAYYLFTGSGCFATCSQSGCKGHRVFAVRSIGK